MKRAQENIGILEAGNSVSFLTDYGDVTAIVENDGDILLSTSEEVRPTLSLKQFTQFFGAVKALHAEQTTTKDTKQ